MLLRRGHLRLRSVVTGRPLPPLRRAAAATEHLPRDRCTHKGDCVRALGMAPGVPDGLGPSMSGAAASGERSSWQLATLICGGRSRCHKPPGFWRGRGAVVWPRRRARALVLRLCQRGGVGATLARVHTGPLPNSGLVHAPVRVCDPLGRRPVNAGRRLLRGRRRGARAAQGQRTRGANLESWIPP